VTRPRRHRHRRRRRRSSSLRRSRRCHQLWDSASLRPSSLRTVPPTAASHVAAAGAVVEMRLARRRARRCQRSQSRNRCRGPVDNCLLSAFSPSCSGAPGLPGIFSAIPRHPRAADVSSALRFALLAENYLCPDLLRVPHRPLVWRPALPFTARPANPSSRTHAAGPKLPARTEAVSNGPGPFFSSLPLLLGLEASQEIEFCTSLF